MNNRLENLIPDEQVETLLEAGRALVGMTMVSLTELNDRLTLMQFRALVLLTERGSLKASELARSLGVSGSSVTRLCDRLVREGLVDRRQNPLSRREVILAPSGEAESLVKRVMDARRADLRRILAKLHPDDRRPLLDAMEKLILAADRSLPLATESATR